MHPEQVTTLHRLTGGFQVQQCSLAVEPCTSDWNLGATGVMVTGALKVLGWHPSSKLIQVADRVKLFSVWGQRTSFPCWILARPPWILCVKTAHIPRLIGFFLSPSKPVMLRQVLVMLLILKVISLSPQPSSVLSQRNLSFRLCVLGSSGWSKLFPPSHGLWTLLVCENRWPHMWPTLKMRGWTS